MLLYKKLLLMTFGTTLVHSVQFRQNPDNDKQISSALWQHLSVVTDAKSVLICTRCRGLEIVKRIVLRSKHTHDAA